MYAALKAYLEKDHKKEWDGWIDRTNRIASQLAGIPTLKSETHVNPGPANAFPSLRVTWDSKKVKTSPRDVVQKLKEGKPSIVMNAREDVLTVGVVLLRPNQVNIVAKRLKEVLLEAVGS